MKKKNLVIFLPNFSAGGAGNSIVNICKNLNQKKYNIFILSLKRNYYKQDLLKYCKEVKEIDCLSTLFSLNKINDYLKKFDKNNTLLISNINYANSLFVLYFKILKKFKLIIIERTPYQELNIYYSLRDFFKKLIIKIIIKFFYKSADTLIANSRKTANDYSKIIKKNCFYVYPLSFKSKINIKKKNNINDQIKILTIARLSKEKRIEDQIYALKKIEKKKYNLTIVGDGDLKISLNNLIKKYNLKVKIVNYSDKNKIKYLKKSDLYICSSDFEGFPNTVVDAINYGLPVISSNNHGGINEILLNGYGGTFYNARDINDLAKKIKNVVKYYKKELKKNVIAKNKLNRFSELNIKKYEQIFDKVLIK